MGLLTRFLAGYLRSGLRGSYRLTDLLSNRLKSLQAVPIKAFEGTVYLDLRSSSARGLLARPNGISGEDNVMRHFVREGDTVFDIGAHLGLYTVLLSKLAGADGTVYAFEPNPELMPSLERTIGGLKNVELLRTALSDREGSNELFVPDDASMASMKDWTGGIVGDVHSVTCEMRTLDDLFREGAITLPSFIKCDVEGAELLVFRGAKRLLDRPDAPAILFEANAKAAEAFGLHINSYLDFLTSLEHPDYRFFEVLADGVKDLDPVGIDYTNVVAVPKTRIDRIGEIAV